MAKILVIEDEDNMRAMLCDALEMAGHSVVLASSGAEGVQQFKKEGADLVITDLFMPGMGGDETITALRALAPELKIIAMSGTSVDRGEAELAHKLGVLRVLQKPFLLKNLFAAVAEATGAKK